MPARLRAAKRVPRGVVCLISALQFHRIGTQSPHQVWLALPRGSNFPRSGKLPFRFCKFSEASYAFNVEEHALEGGIVRLRNSTRESLPNGFSAAMVGRPSRRSFTGSKVATWCAFGNVDSSPARVS
jgi:hypothetical protein